MPPDLSPRQSWTALLAFGLLLGGAAAAVFVAGGAPQGNLGVFLICAGVALVACPPRVRVEGRLWAAAGGLVGCSGLAFLPARWLPMPRWREVVGAVPVIHLPETVTAAPGETAFWVGVLALSALVGLFTLTQPVRSRGMIGLALAAVTVGAAYAALAMYAKATGWVYPFAGGASFGFLPNRNHSATFLITGAVVSAGLMSVAFRDRRWILADVAMAGGLTCATALCFFSGSRAGVLILFAGGGLWLAGLGGRHRPGRLLLVAAVVALAGGGLFLTVNSPARERMLSTVGARWGGGVKKAKPTPTPVAASGNAVAAPVTNAGEEAVETPADFRLSVYRDAWRMVRDQPWTGTGLGTFAGVFAQYRETSLVRFNALHPESDWLMLAAEAGLPACGFALALVVMTLARPGGGARREHPFWPLRWGFGAAAGAALLHSLADVPAHRAAVGWWVLVLAGVGWQGRGGAVVTGERNFNAETRRTRRLAEEEEEGRWGRGGVQRGVFVLGGVGALVLGGMLVRAEWMGGPALPPFAALQAPQQMFEAYQRKDYQRGEEIGRRILRTSPLTAAVYYYAGIFQAVSDEEGVDQKVDEWFQAERVLDPVMPEVPHRQAMAWAGYDPARQAAMAVDELGRLGRITRALGRGWQENRGFYEVMVTDSRAEGELDRALLAVTRPDPRYVETWKRSARPESLAGGLARIEADQAWLDEGKGTLRADWFMVPERVGPAPPGVVAGAENGTMPEWWYAAWPVRLRQMVYAGRYREAVEAMEARYGISLGQAGGGEAEAEVWREKAARAAAEGNWKEAWLALERYVRRTRQIEWP